MKRQFCKDILEFLKSEYKDAYEFNLELTRDQCCVCNLELKITSGEYTLKINNNCMLYLFELYRNKICVQKSSQLKWQKELMDMIERY